MHDWWILAVHVAPVRGHMETFPDSAFCSSKRMRKYKIEENATGAAERGRGTAGLCVITPVLMSYEENEVGMSNSYS